MLTKIQKEWASRRKQNISSRMLAELVAKQHGRCKLSDVEMVIDKREGTPQDGKGCHPLYAAVDHISPGNPVVGVQLVCYALNDLKGHLPLACFQALVKTKEWGKLMLLWKAQALKNPNDRAAFKNIIRPEYITDKK